MMIGNKTLGVFLRRYNTYTWTQEDAEAFISHLNFVYGSIPGEVEIEHLLLNCGLEEEHDCDKCIFVNICEQTWMNEWDGTYDATEIDAAEYRIHSALS